MSKWDMVRLGDIATVVSGSTPKTSVAEYWNGELCWITPAEIADTDTIIKDTVRKITAKAVDDTGLKPLPKGTVLLSSRAPIGKVAITGVEMYCNQGFKNLICSDAVHNKYIFWYLKGKTDYLNSLGRGATFKEVSKRIIEDILIPLPPLDIQRKIAKTLDTVSEMLAMRKQQLAELDNLIKSTFYDMFGDPVTNEKGWKLVHLGNHVKVMGGFAFSSKGFCKEGIPVIKISNINSGVFEDKGISFWKYEEKLDRYLLSPGDLVVSMTGTVGKDDYANLCILPEKYPQYYLNQRNAKLQLDNTINSQYLLYLLKDNRVRNQLTGISRGIRQANISNRDINQLNVPLPPRELQDTFSKKVVKVEEQRMLLSIAFREVKCLFDSLMAQYFN